jgi:heme exporter protein CcmD
MKDYSSYILAAYGFAAVLVGFVVAKIALDYRDLKSRLARFGGREDER